MDARAGRAPSDGEGQEALEGAVTRGALAIRAGPEAGGGALAGGGPRIRAIPGHPLRPLAGPPRGPGGAGPGRAPRAGTRPRGRGFGGGGVVGGPTSGLTPRPSSSRIPGSDTGRRGSGQDHPSFFPVRARGAATQIVRPPHGEMRRDALARVNRCRSQIVMFSDEASADRGHSWSALALRSSALSCRQQGVCWRSSTGRASHL